MDDDAVRQAMVQWVIDNVKPGNMWRWHEPGSEDVLIVIHGFHTPGDRHIASPYRIEFSHFFVGDTDSRSEPYGETPLPNWFIEAMNDDVYYMLSNRFKELVDEGRLTLCPPA